MTELKDSFIQVNTDTRSDDDVWTCPCGCAWQLLHRDGSITCIKCNTDHKQVWDWKE